jgi:UDP-glucose 4-epimerase
MSAASGVPFQLKGADYDTPDGTCIRDFIHVTDIADAHVLAVNYLLRGGASCALNLANSRGFSVKDVIASVEGITRRKVPVQIMPRRDGDPPVLIGESRQAQALLGWQPRKSELDVQINDAWNWLKRNIKSG